jgi:ankyrin repeat protein
MLEHLYQKIVQPKKNRNNMQFTMLMLSIIVAIIPEYVGAQTFEEQGQAILNRIYNNTSQSQFEWKPSGPTAEDIQAGMNQVCQDEEELKVRNEFANRELGNKLKRAVEKGDLKDVKNLIAAAAFFEISDYWSWGKSPAQADYTDIVNVLITAGVQAVEKGEFKDIKPLIAAKAVLECSDYWGKTPLMSAAENGYTDIVNVLINAGAHVDAQQEYGATALTYALDKGHTEIAKLLIGKAKNSCDLQALTCAIDKENTEIVKLLITHDALKKNQADFGSLFIKVVKQGDNEMAKTLMATDIALDHTTLMIAARIAQRACSAEIAKAVEDLLQKSHAKKSKN